ncbi:presenilin [Chloropicon primus]|uniref:Presenilin n=1 Tax=Chloropicon primus TaxID=1764295 RepID=A0A5B8MNN2_9CHLO|nr:presenilin [Chloropicon primus]UPR01141.1 presenilin [Chloropicon primus]|mmetsp:Transcript_11853/g.32738  ORF Transcript_11853/g.32738 Transcript_11853/m.32738 type:complete len:433 (+) Transcript_11853:170-1468(+)|eukprot:QDZ21921.1 presenilin [Chloropicon primus]
MEVQGQDVEEENNVEGLGGVRESILSSLGEEITAIVAPVTACMALTVCLVRALYLEGRTLSTAPTSIATAMYHESASDDVETKVTGALLNALVFVIAITIMTFVMFLLFKYNCTKCLYGYMAFSSFTLLFFMGGYFLQVLFEISRVPFDAISFVFLLFNTAIVGTVAMWTDWTPFVLKQAYLVLVAVVIAALFTRIPAWTTWFLLGALVIYDLCAVLLPGGPLKALVELAMERNEAIPALVYESKLTRGFRDDPRREREAGSEARDVAAQGYDDGQLLVREPTDSASTSTASPSEITAQRTTASEDRREEDGEVSVTEPLMGQQENQDSAGKEVGLSEEDMELPDSIKLGLGDFIFYSVLVGQASLFDMTTVYVCYLAIMAGLGATLLLLAIYQKALPALPISITLGVVFYFCTRYFLDPTVTPISVSLLYA